MLQDKARLRALIKDHRGNLSAIAAALNMAGDEITRQGLCFRLERLGLAEVAAKARATHSVTGPRTEAMVEQIDNKLRSALAATVDLDAASRKLGITRRTLYRRMLAAKIRPSAVAKLRAKRLQSVP